ncbi:MAG TPA: hypothetical protein VFX03_09335, partial [Thermomicrobiales bacterium]|nr:hypothetical protein [Thermomicrobiales bacterium]
MQVFVDPHPRAAIGEAATLDDVLSRPAGGKLGDDLLLVFLPAGAATPIEAQRRAEQWMTDASPGGQPT